MDIPKTDNLLIFNKLPSEILKQILLILDLNSLLLYFRLNKSAYLLLLNKLDDILKAKITLSSNINTKNLIIEQLINLVKTLGKSYGTVQNNQFKIFTRKYDFDHLFNRRMASSGRDCDTLKNSELMDMLWDIGGPLPDNHVMLTENDRKDIIKQLLGQVEICKPNGKIMFLENHLIIKKYNYNNMINWNLMKLIFYYNWMRSYTNNSILREIIKNRMIELNIVKYL